MPTIQYKSFTISYQLEGRDDKILRIVKENVPEEQFGAAVNEAYAIAKRFKRSKPGTTWGCDGIGYIVQKRKAQVEVMSSGILPKYARLTMDKLAKEEQQQHA